jgi:hypothetical protein
MTGLIFLGSSLYLVFYGFLFCIKVAADPRYQDNIHWQALQLKYYEITAWKPNAKVDPISFALSRCHFSLVC